MGINGSDFAPPPERGAAGEGRGPFEASRKWAKHPADGPLIGTDEQLEFRRFASNLRTRGETGLMEGDEQRRLLARPCVPTFVPARESILAAQRIDSHLVMLQDGEPSAVAAYSRLAVGLLCASSNRYCKRILVASSRHGEGRTSVTLNLAGALARSGQRVLVIDTDLMRPSALRLLGVDSDHGLAEAFRERLSGFSAIMRILPLDFHLLPTRARVEDSSELLSSPIFADWLDALEPEYDFLLFDSAPLVDSADGYLLALQTHAFLLVVRPGHTRTRQMARAIAPLNQENLLGVVINRALA